jgi:hypothetical protein
MCPICIRECTVLCEIGKSAFRGREVLYPSPQYFGDSTAASNKDYLLNWSDIQIQTALLGAQGIEADSDLALFPNVDVSSRVGGIATRVPVLIAGLGSTDVARRNWASLAIGAALSGVPMVIGENVCGMDEKADFGADGKVLSSPAMQGRVETYRRFWDGEHGDIIVQTNVEDQRAGVDVYALNELGVTTIERKWGQGAKAIGGEVRVDNLEKALMLKRRGYLVLPDPEDPAVPDAFNHGSFRTFERHSRVGMIAEEAFVEDIAWLREQGAKRVFLKTGAYAPAAVAFTLRCGSRAGIDAITFDGAGGGTGMSPVPMMNECSTPTLFLLAQVLEGVRLLRRNRKHVPDICIAGGFVNETQILKALAMSNFAAEGGSTAGRADGQGPIVRAVAMARAPITAAMKAGYFAELAETGGVPRLFGDSYGSEPDQFFITAPELRARFGDAVGLEIPWGAVGVYTYFSDRLKVGLQQLMAGCRKWRLDLLDRNDLAALSERAASVTGLPLVEDAQREAFHKLLNF